MRRSARIATKVEVDKERAATTSQSSPAPDLLKVASKPKKSAQKFATASVRPVVKRGISPTPPAENLVDPSGSGSSVVKDEINDSGPSRALKRIKKESTSVESSTSVKTPYSDDDDFYPASSNHIDLYLDQEQASISVANFDESPSNPVQTGRRRAATKKPKVEVSSDSSDSVHYSEDSEDSDSSYDGSSDGAPVTTIACGRKAGQGRTATVRATRGRATRVAHRGRGNRGRAAGRAHRRTSRYSRAPAATETPAYYQTHPTLDPKIWKLHPEIGTIWDVMDGIPLIEVEEADQPEDLKLKMLPFQKEGLNWMKKQELGEFNGGLLADEMGMGKTIQMISLLLSEPRGKPNLIVAPTVALMQWCSEIKTHTSSLSVLMFHGQDRSKSIDELMSYDVILTTYNIIESCFRKQQYGFKRKGETVKEDSLIHKINWFRVILDEGHYIKDRSCSTARAVFAMKAQRKWALSGTPLQNRVGELYSLIRFLKADPFSYYFCKKCPCKSLSWKFNGGRTCSDCGHSPMNHFCWWNADILKPIQNHGCDGEGGVAFEKLGKLLDRIMLRRTKVQKADDLGLPPRVVTVRRDVFNEEEEDMYTSLYSDSKRKFTSYVAEGTVLNHYANIFELITKMRLAVNHPDLILKRIPTAKAVGIEHAPSTSSLESRLVCIICHDVPEDPIASKCKHIFCREDARQFLELASEAHPKCPSCFVPLTIDLSQPTVQLEDDGNELIKAVKASADGDFQAGGETFRGSIVNRINLDTWRSSTKIEALVEELDKLRSQDHTIKSIVFSQFVNFLDLVHWRLSRAGFACCRLDGRMRPAQRDAIIKTFMQNHQFTVFLISLKAGGIALNLTEASRVFLCDPWWNPAVEDQAMDRIHRLGQRRPIQITRLVVENSIESRILQLQAKKHALFESTIGKDTTALARLTEEDLKFLFVL